MLPTPLIPHVFRADTPDLLRSDVERLSDGMREWARRASERALTIPKLTSEKTVSGTVSVGFEETVRVAPALTTDSVKVTLPRNGPQHTCKSLHVIRLTTVGRVVLWPTDCFINGATSFVLLCSPMLTTIMSDGKDFYASNAGAGDA